MIFKKQDLLTLLISLFILGGCKNPTGVGLDVDPDLQLNTKVVDTTTLITQLVKEDTIATNRIASNPMGYFKDPVFGITEANFAAALTLPSGGFPSFGTNPLLDSAILVLPVAGFYGDSINTQYVVEVRRLNEVLYKEPTPTYYNTKKWNALSTVIGTKTFSAKVKDSIIIQDIKVAAKDTVRRASPQIRIRLDQNFIINTILKADSSKLTTNKNFADYFKGVYVTLSKTQTTNNGGLLSLTNGANTPAGLDIFYKKPKTAIVSDTLKASFPINYAGGDAASEISWTVSPTINAQLANNTGKSNLIYLKGLAGTKLRVQFPYIKSLKNLGKNIAVNAAQLILTVENSTETPYVPIPLLKVFRLDIAERPQVIADENQNDSRNIVSGTFVGGFYDKSKKIYIINVTNYVQDLLSGKTKDYGTFLSTYDFTSPGSRLSVLGRSVIGGNTNQTVKLKLKVFYTDQK